MAEPTNETTAQIARLEFLRAHEHLISPWAFSKVERKSRDYEFLAVKFNGVKVVQSTPSMEQGI